MNYEFYHRSENWELRGQTVRWAGSDNERLWEENNDPKNEKWVRQLADNNWTLDSVSYAYNSEGFRADEFVDGDDGILFLGCSHTEGTGIPYEKTWAYNVAKRLGLKNWNLAQCGSSNDGAFRLASYWIPRLKPKRVFMLSTHASRTELIDHNGIQYFLPSLLVYRRKGLLLRRQFDGDPKKHPYVPYYETWSTNNPNTRLNREKNLLAIDSITKSVGGTFHFLHAEKEIPSAHDEMDLARDLVHHGLKWNERMTERVLDVLGNKSENTA